VGNHYADTVRVSRLESFRVSELQRFRVACQGKIERERAGFQRFMVADTPIPATYYPENENPGS